MDRCPSLYQQLNGWASSGSSGANRCGIHIVPGQKITDLRSTTPSSRPAAARIRSSRASLRYTSASSPDSASRTRISKPIQAVRGRRNSRTPVRKLPHELPPDRSGSVVVGAGVCRFRTHHQAAFLTQERRSAGAPTPHFLHEAPDVLIELPLTAWRRGDQERSLRPDIPTRPAPISTPSSPRADSAGLSRSIERRARPRPAKSRRQVRRYSGHWSTV